MATFGAVGAHGEGGITRRSDGRLQVSITMPNRDRIVRYVGKDKDGRRQRRAAELLLRELREARERDLYPSSQTLADYLRSWIAAQHDKVRPRTIEHYRYVVESFVIPALGTIRLDRLTPRHVQEWIDADTSASVHHHRAVLRRALNAAVRRQVIRDNPALSVEMPDPQRFTGSPLSEAEARRLLALPDRLTPLWRLAIDSGLRVSELLGLAWDDLDLDAGTLTLANQLYRDAAGWQFVEPKTGRDDLIHLAPSTVSALREHQRAMAAERTPEWRYFGLVFTTARGNPIGRSEVLRAFHAACDASGIARRRVHDLRGTSATILEEQGIPEPARMRRLGHTTTKMARHYAQGRAVDKLAAEAIERAIG